MDLEQTYQALMARTPPQYLTLTQTLDAAHIAITATGAARTAALTDLARGITALAENKDQLEAVARRLGPQHEAWLLYHLNCATAHYGIAAIRQGRPREIALHKAQQFLRAVSS